MITGRLVDAMRALGRRNGTEGGERLEDELLAAVLTSLVSAQRKWKEGGEKRTVAVHASVSHSTVMILAMASTGSPPPAALSKMVMLNLLARMSEPGARRASCCRCEQ